MKLKLKKMQWIACFLLFIFLNISSFAQKPIESYPAIDYKPVLSSIQSPVILAIRTLEDELNIRMKYLIFENPQLQTDGYGTYAVKVWKIEPIKLQGEENKNRIFSQTALKIWVKGDYKTTVLGLETSYPIDQTVSLRMNISTELNLNADWQLQTKTQIEDYEWIEKPVLDLGLIQISLTSLVDRVIRQQQSSFTSQFDETMKKFVQVREPIEQAWQAFQMPMPISEWQKDSTWLVLQPKELTLSPFICQDNKLKTFLKVKSFADASIGAKPLKTNILKLPKLKLENNKPADFEFRILGKIDRQLAIQKAKAIFMAETYEYKKYKTKIVDMNIYGSGNLMVIELDMEGSIDGKIYLTGKPVYDKRSQTLQIMDLTYKLQGTGTFSKFAEWLFRGRIKKMIEKSMEEPINAQIQAIRAQIEKTLSNYQLDKNTLIQGNLLDFYFDKIFMNEKEIYSEVYLKGNFTITLLGF